MEKWKDYPRIENESGYFDDQSIDFGFPQTLDEV